MQIGTASRCFKQHCLQLTCNEIIMRYGAMKAMTDAMLTYLLVGVHVMEEINVPLIMHATMGMVWAKKVQHIPYMKSSMVGRLEVLIGVESFQLLSVPLDVGIVGLDMIWGSDLHIGYADGTNEVHKVGKNILHAPSFSPHNRIKVIRRCTVQITLQLSVLNLPC